MQGPEENSPGYSFLFLTGLVNGIIETFEHTGNSTHHRRMNLTHVVGDGGQALGIIDGHATILVAVDQCAFVGVAYGQEAEGLVRAIADRVLEVRELVHQVMVREHHALRRSCRARSIDNGGALHLVDSGLASCHFFGVRMFLSKLEQLVEIRILLSVDHGIDQFHIRCIRQDVGHFVHHGEAVDDHHLGVAVGQNETVILLANGRINRHGDGADLADSHVEHVPFGAVGKDHGNLVTLLNA